VGTVNGDGSGSDVFTFVNCVFNSPAQGSLCLVITVAFNYPSLRVTRIGCSFPIFAAGIVVVRSLPTAPGNMANLNPGRLLNSDGYVHIACRAAADAGDRNGITASRSSPTRTSATNARADDCYACQKS
jgi:hypothetical protein